MTLYHFDIVSDGIASREVVEAIDDDAVIRQALLLVSEIVRDHALCSGAAISVALSVRDEADRLIWSGTASADQARAPGAP